MPKTPPSRSRVSQPAPPFTPLSGTTYGSRQPTPLTINPQSLSLLGVTPHPKDMDAPTQRTHAKLGALRWRGKRIMKSPLLWLLATLMVLGYVWTVSDRSQRTRHVFLTSKATNLLPPDFDSQLAFFPASNPKIHYVGRWTSTPNHQRMDGTFPGVYFDLRISNTTCLFLSLENTPPKLVTPSPTFAPKSPAPTFLPGSNHLSFSASSKITLAASPISLLARVDQEEHILLPNSSAHVLVCTDLDPTVTHDIRVIAPMPYDNGTGMIQLNGVWLNRGGKLLRVPGSPVSGQVDDEDEGEAEIVGTGDNHGARLRNFQMHRHDSVRPSTGTQDLRQDDIWSLNETRIRLLETITDSPGCAGLRRRDAPTESLLTGVMGWEYLVGEMFDADHVTIGVDGMCLSQGCIGGTGEPFGLGDVFFRSGPAGSAHFKHPWTFQSYVPDVILINVGASDHASFNEHSLQYGQTAWDLGQGFEDAYVSLVKAIRQLAYAEHPASLEAGQVAGAGHSSHNAPPSVPVFIMRPFGGQLEHFAHGAVRRLREDGDQAVFWVDTSGWLDMEDTSSDDRDFYEDDSMSPPRLRLTERGNQRASIFLHMHLCPYLADVDDQCAFLAPEVYHGKMFDPSEAAFDRYLESEKETKLKEYFWGLKA